MDIEQVVEGDSANVEGGIEEQGSLLNAAHSAYGVEDVIGEESSHSVPSGA